MFRVDVDFDNGDVSYYTLHIELFGKMRKYTISAEIAYEFADFVNRFRPTPVAADAVLAPAGDGDGDTHRAAEHDG